MAAVCFPYRRRRICFILIVVTLVWLIYLFAELPSKGGLMSFPGQVSSNVHDKQLFYLSHSGKYLSTTSKQVPKVNKNILNPPQLLNDKFSPEGQIADKKANVDEDEKIDKVNLDFHAIGQALKNQTLEFGIRLKNKSLQVGEGVKNKTLQHLAVIGVGAQNKNLPSIIYVPAKWNLNVSFEDIGDIMKETQFLNNVSLLNLNGPILVSARNRTANFSFNMPLKFGYCDCFEHSCLCCGQLTNERLHLNTTTCTNFTFISKTQEFDLKVTMDSKAIYQSQISADKPPLLCIGSWPKVADICIHFFNMTFKVNEHNAYQTQLLGCTDFSLNLYNKTIGAFPVDCFQIPGDPNQIRKGRHFDMVFNWVP